MAEVKWVKLSTSMFDDEKIRVIESMPSGMEICLIWIKLIVLAGKVNDDGCIYLTKDIPYTDDMLAKIFDQRPEIVKSALDAFQKLGMIEILEDRKIALVNWGKHQSIEGMDKIREQTRARVQRLREKRALLPCNVTSNATVTQVTHPRVRLELDKNKDKEPVSTPVAPTRNTASVPKVAFVAETGMFQNISDKQVEIWEGTYPALEILTEIAKASAWLKANPNKLKKNYHRFLVNWFSRAQEKGGDRKYAKR